MAHCDTFVKNEVFLGKDTKTYVIKYKFFAHSLKYLGSQDAITSIKLIFGNYCFTLDKKHTMYGWKYHLIWELVEKSKYIHMFIYMYVHVIILTIVNAVFNILYNVNKCYFLYGLSLAAGKDRIHFQKFLSEHRQYHILEHLNCDTEDTLYFLK